MVVGEPQWTIGTRSRSTKASRERTNPKSIRVSRRSSRSRSRQRSGSESPRTTRRRRVPGRRASPGRSPTRRSRNGDETDRGPGSPPRAGRHWHQPRHHDGRWPHCWFRCKPFTEDRGFHRSNAKRAMNMESARAQTSDSRCRPAERTRAIGRRILAAKQKE
jgi:hypothetical protein